MIETDEFDIQKLKQGWHFSLALGILSFLVGIIVLDQPSDPELVTIVIIFALSAIIFSAAFFFFCLIFAPRLGRFIKDENTTVEGPTVKMVTTIEESGDVETDRWVQRYVFARNMFGLSIIPLLILAGLFLFA